MQGHIKHLYFPFMQQAHNPWALIFHGPLKLGNNLVYDFQLIMLAYKKPMDYHLLKDLPNRYNSPYFRFIAHDK